MKSAYIATLFFVITFSAAAQDNLSKEVDVTRAYEPSIDDSYKQSLTPDMTDTTQLVPEFNYSITPAPASYEFDVRRINPANINTIENRAIYPFYLKVGVGLPLQSVLDFEYSRQLSERSKAGGFLTHFGEFSKVRNDQGVRAPIDHTSTALTLFGERKYGNDVTLAGDLNYDFRSITRYGYYNFGRPMPEVFDSTRNGLLQFFHRLQGSGSIGNSFKDFSKVNVRFTTEFAYLADRFKYDMFSIRGILDVGFGAGENANIRARINQSSRRGFNNMSAYKSDLLTTGALYNFKNEEISFSLGADVLFDVNKGEQFFLPVLTIEKPILDESMTGYFALDGRAISNNYMYLSYVNPFIAEGLRMRLTIEHDARLGIKGTLAGMLKYRVYAGYSYHKNSVIFYNQYEGRSFSNIFGAVSDNMTFWTAGGEADIRVLRSLSLSGSIQAFSYNNDTYLDGVGLPDIQFSFGANYNFGKKLFLNIAGTIYGERIFLEQRIGGDFGYNKVNYMTDLNFKADYFISRELGVFFNLNNILNQRLYLFNRYPLPGINALAGVKLYF